MLGVWIRNSLASLLIETITSHTHKPAMGFIYKAMDEAKEKIQVNFGYVKKKYISC